MVKTEQQPTIKTPKQVLNNLAVPLESLVYNFTCNNETFCNIFPDTILEYKEHAGREECYADDWWTTNRYNYLETYVSVGITTKLYNRIFKEARYNHPNLESVHNSINDDYTWITADISQNLYCHIQSDILRTIITEGSLLDMMTKLGSNIGGIAQFKIQVAYKDFYFLKFTLTGYLLVDKTNISCSESSVDVDLTEELKNQLKLANDRE